jgi:uncharacterized protein
MITMLELRPTCEHCNKALPPHAADACICSFECTFCASCVTTVLRNVCPNCGGGFVPRPIRPAKAWVGDVSLVKRPASAVIKHKAVDLVVHKALIDRLKDIPPTQR